MRLNISEIIHVVWYNINLNLPANSDITLKCRAKRKETKSLRKDFRDWP